MTARPWTRRSVLALGVAAVGLGTRSSPVHAAEVAVGDLSFVVPAMVRAAPAETFLGPRWQWQGRAAGPPTVPRTVVLARADLPGVDAEEILGLVLAGSAAGWLANLRLSGRRTRSMPGGGDQTRVAIAYSAGPDLRYFGELLIATRPAPPSALLVVLGDDSLTAGTIDGVLDSARWRS